jgi:hypothetical protein
MTTLTCSVSECEEPKSPKAGKGMCGPHYHQWRKLAAPRCAVDECDKAAAGKGGYCGAHQLRVHAHGHPQADKPIRRLVSGDPFGRFEAWSQAMPSGCVEWQGAKRRGGYGSFQFERKAHAAHRWLWVHTHGPIEDGLVVRHKCDNVACVNIDHLELGTAQENSQDMVDRERSLRGSIHHKAKLVEYQVVDIRDALRNGARPKDLGEYYGVSASLIGMIGKRQIWKHIP